MLNIVLDAVRETIEQGNNVKLINTGSDQAIFVSSSKTLTKALEKVFDEFSLNKDEVLGLVSSILTGIEGKLETEEEIRTTIDLKTGKQKCN
jgi:nucleoid DNA-binding protein